MSASIVNQPVRTIRFRTAKELTDGNHGSLKGSEDFPSVAYKTEREGACKVVVAVHSLDSTEQLVKLSPHGFIETKPPKGRPKRTRHLLVENMHYNAKQKSHHFSLDQHMLYKYTQRELEGGYLRCKYADFNRECATNFALAQLGDTKKVRLGFTILQADESAPRPLYTRRATVLSDPICDWAKTFSVYFVCNPTVIFTGGRALVTVLVLVDLRVSNLQIDIRSQQTDVAWTLQHKSLTAKENLDSLQPGQFYVFHRRTIIISLPEGCSVPGKYTIVLQQDEQGMNVEITVRNELAVDLSDMQPDDFEFLNSLLDDLEPNGMAAQASPEVLPATEADALETIPCRVPHKSSLDLAMAELLAAKGRSFANEAEAFDYYRKWNSRDSVHEALQVPLVHFYRLTTLNQEMPYLDKYMGQCRNRQGDNLLHHACRLGKHQFVRSLVRIQCRLDAFNNNLETPLHIAIAQRDTECLKVFVQLLETIDEADSTDYSHVGQQLLKACHMLDFGGQNILHRAVNGGYAEFVLAVLRYSRSKNGKNIGRLPESSQGNTIAHLAVFREDEKLAAAICALEPEAETYTNYRGRTCWQIKMGEGEMDEATDEEDSDSTVSKASDVEEQPEEVKQSDDLEYNLQQISIK